VRFEPPLSGLVHAVLFRVKKPAQLFAVARNCGMGSSSLNADVNAFDKLHIVLDSNSGAVA